VISEAMDKKARLMQSGGLNWQPKNETELFKSFDTGKENNYFSIRKFDSFSLEYLFFCFVGLLFKHALVEANELQTSQIYFVKNGEKFFLFFNKTIQTNKTF